jgi:hypothetical protein
MLTADAQLMRGRRQSLTPLASGGSRRLSRVELSQTNRVKLPCATWPRRPQSRQSSRAPKLGHTELAEVEVLIDPVSLPAPLWSGNAGTSPICSAARVSPHRGREFLASALHPSLPLSTSTQSGFVTSVASRVYLLRVGLARLRRPQDFIAAFRLDAIPCRWRRRVRRSRS